MTMRRTASLARILVGTAAALALMLGTSDAPAQGGPQPERDAMLGFPRAPADQEWIESLRHAAWFDDRRDPGARVFWSPDSTQLLVVPGAGDSAYVGTAAGGFTHGVARRLVVAGADRATMTSEALSSLRDTRGGAPIRVALEPPLVGEVAAGALLTLRPDYAARAEAYEPRADALARLAAARRPMEIRVYFGAWDPVSRESVPRLMSVMRRIQDSAISVRYFGLNEGMTEPADEIQRYRIDRVPTILVTIDGEEIGRAEPDRPIEEELARLAAGR